ncbi:MAG: type II toxin-antitoxin system RelE/ParE family toxin [Dethiobacter sp.]|jgi:plasmid stabilization system protein ParE|nr:type II toxin-antitoxin system RelE/ParE family toxin [Dethiobacter sp.]MBS3989876.1 type II toxin-antitoxin system RelE/ParE family toxin [Dethiobacter sp.]
MARYRIDISEPAEYDLRDIVRYISAQLFAPMTAIKMMDTMNEAIAGLALMPQKCTFVTDERLAMLGYRKLPVKNYIVFFTINEKLKVVDVERILYARRDWQRIL